MSMNMFFQAFAPKDLDARREDHDLIDAWVESEKRCTASVDVETAWDVLRHILDETGFRSDGVADGVLSNGCDFISPELVKEQARNCRAGAVRACAKRCARSMKTPASITRRCISTRKAI